MNVLHVISSISPAGGGPSEAVLQLSRALLELGHESEVATLDDPGSPWISHQLVNVHALGPTMLGYGYRRGLHRELLQLASRFEAVVVHGLWQYHTVAARRALRGTGIPYYVFAHGMLGPWADRQSKLKRLKKLLYWPFEHRVLSEARAVLFTCEEERRLARNSYKPYRVKEAVVGLGTAGPPATTATDAEAFFSAFPELRGCRILLFLGRLHPVKACDILIEAFCAVDQGHDGRTLVLAGPDPMGIWPSLKAIAEGTESQKRVRWIGSLDAEMRWAALRASEALVLVSHHENFGVVVAEALACGTPVLISDKVNIWREIEQAGAGMVGEDTREGVISLLKKWGSMPEDQREAMGALAQTAFREKFDVSSAARNLIALLENGSQECHGT